MDEQKAKSILGDRIKENSIFDGLNYISYEYEDSEACLDGYFNADELEAIVWCMRNKKQVVDITN